MDDSPYWLLWAITILLAGWKCVEGFIRPKKLVEWPFLASATCLYFYGYMSINAKLFLDDYFEPNVIELGQFLALACLTGIILGWNSGLRAPMKRALGLSYGYKLAWYTGTGLTIIGTLVHLTFLSSVTSGRVTYQNSSAYWYLLFYIAYPGLSLSLWSLYKSDKSFGSSRFIITILVFSFFMIPHLVTARRGPLFPAIIIMMFVPPLTTKIPPNRVYFVLVLVCTGALMLFFVETRKFIYHDGSWADAYSEISLNDALTSKSTKVEDNEFLLNCTFVSTTIATGKYQYGTGHLSLLLHWIPRKFWPNKPEIGEGIYSYSEVFDDVDARSKWQMSGTGGSCGGFAESFMQYGFLAPLFWYVLSFVFARYYKMYQRKNDPVALFTYVGLISASHWLLSQGFNQAVVPGMAFIVLPRIALAIFRHLDPSTSATRKVDQKINDLPNHARESSDPIR